MSTTEAVVERYIAMWNEPDGERRRGLVAQTLTEDATYVDPAMTGEGIEGITTMIGGAQEQFPGLRFKLISGPDAHHDRVRFSWSLGQDGSEPVAVGVDFATLAGRRPDAVRHRIPGPGPVAGASRSARRSTRPREPSSAPHSMQISPVR